MINQEKTQAQHLQFLGDLYVVHQVQAFCPGGARGGVLFQGEVTVVLIATMHYAFSP